MNRIDGKGSEKASQSSQGNSALMFVAGLGIGALVATIISK